jgi:signal transduction histidine kinase
MSGGRTLSLHVWLAVALTCAIAVPAVVGVAAWGAAGRWQANREQSRERAAIAALSGARLESPAERAELVRRLSALGVEAQLGPSKAGAGDPAAKLALTGKPVVQTAAFDDPDVKPRLDRHRTSTVALPGLFGELWVPRESAATRWAIALAAGLVALAAVLAVVVLLLRRWVLRPLARLAADAERIASGELEVQPPDTRAREVAQVGAALHGMAGGLSDALRRSAAAERDRRFMVTAIAHDLRTPLFTLRGSLEALERGIGDAGYLQRAQSKAAHLDRLVSDLFTFSRLEYAREAIGFEEVDVGSLVVRAAGDVEPLAVARGCRLELRGASEPLVTRGDADALTRVLTNLLDNAIRHSRGRIVVGTRRENGSIRVDVADNGPGFAPDDLGRVFEPLFRSDRARGATTGGTGLGLAIARRLARAHGGDVDAANVRGGGALTTVTLPFAGD